MRRIPNSSGHNEHDFFLHVFLLMYFFSKQVFFNIIWYYSKEIDPKLSWALKLSVRLQKLTGYIGQDI